MIFAIIGKSGSGKTSIVKKVENYKVPLVVQCTTRPQRYGEIHGVDYNFKTHEQFLDMVLEKEMATYQSFEVASGDIWLYGYRKSAIDYHKDCVLVANPKELRSLKSLYGSEVVTIQIVADEKTRIERCFNRDTMSKDNMKELTRRMIADERDFANVIPDHIVENIKDLESAINKTNAIIERTIKEKEESIPRKRLHFYTGVMKSGKSERLINRISSEFTKKPSFIALKPSKDTRSKSITSRNGKSVECQSLLEQDDIYKIVEKHLKDNNINRLKVFIDESQFLTNKQVRQIIETIKNFKFVDFYCAGLMIDYQGKIFDSSSTLMWFADRVVKTPYKCERCSANNATNHLLKVDGKVVTSGDNIVIESENAEYSSVCLHCYVEAIKGR